MDGFDTDADAVVRSGSVMVQDTVVVFAAVPVESLTVTARGTTSPRSVAIGVLFLLVGIADLFDVPGVVGNERLWCPMWTAVFTQIGKPNWMARKQNVTSSPTGCISDSCVS